MSDIIGGTFAKGIAHSLNLSFHAIERREYPDSEVCPRIKVQGELEGPVYLILRPKQDQNLNAYLTEFLLTLNNVAEHVEQIYAFMPYMVYARQDKTFRPGEPLSSKIVAELIEKSGATAFYTLTVHLHRIKLKQIFNIEVQNLSAIPLLAKYTKETYTFHNPVILAPDDEALTWAKQFASEIGSDLYVSIHKERDLNTGSISTKMPDIDLGGREVIIVDDIIATGETMISACEHAREHGAEYVIGCAVHPVLVDDALSKLRRLNLEGLFTTNTLPSKISKVDVRDVIVHAIQERRGTISE